MLTREEIARLDAALAAAPSERLASAHAAAAIYLLLLTGCRAKLEDLAGHSLGWMLDACREAVQPFFDLEEWSDMEIYDPLIEVLERLLNQNGMYTRAQGDSIYVDMPYTGFHDL